jgi:hypothetical protein
VEVNMPAVDQLPPFLAEDSRNIAVRVVAAGYSEDEIRGVWNFARRAGWVAPTGFRAVRLTDAGRSRAGAFQ